MNMQGFPPMGNPHQQFFPPMGQMGGMGGPMPMGGQMGMGGPGPMSQPTTPAAGGAKTHAGPVQAPHAAGPVTVSMSRLNFKPQETALFDRLFQEADSIGRGSLPGSAVKGLFRKSQLNNQVLGVIWTLSDSNKKKALNKDDFYIACRLISLAQNHLPVTEAGLKQFVDVPLPIFDINAHLPTASMMPPSTPTSQHPQQQSAPSMGFGNAPQGSSSMGNFGNQPAVSPAAQPPSQQQKSFPDSNAGFDSGLGGLGGLPPLPSQSSAPATPSLNNTQNSMGFGGNIPPLGSGMNNSQQFGGPNSFGNSMQMPQMQMHHQPEISQAQIDEFKGVQGQLENSRKDLESKQIELKHMREVLEAGPNAISAMKKEIQDLETQAAVAESQMNQMRAQFKGIEDMKNTQYAILQTRKDQAARLFRERAEVQELLNAAQAELERIKYEAGVMKESIPQIHETIIGMRAGLKDLQDVVEEERKNPSKQSGNFVKVGADGKVQLSSATAPAQVAAVAPIKSRQPSMARAPSVFDDDDDYNIDDVTIPTDINAPIKPIAAAPTNNSFGSFDDDGFGSTVPGASSTSHDAFGSFGDDAFGSSAPKAAVQSTNDDAFGSFDDDGFGSSPPAKSLSAAATTNVDFGESSGDFSDPFAGPAAVDPFAATSPTSSVAAKSKPTVDPFGGFDDDFSSPAPAADSKSPNGGGNFDSFGDDPFAAVSPSSENKPAPPKSDLFSDFENGFSSRSSSKPAPPPSLPPMPATSPVAATNIPSPARASPPTPVSAQPPPPPPSMPPAPVPAASPSPPPPAAAAPPAKKLSAFDDDGWDIPDVPGLGGDGFASGTKEENWNDPGNSEWGF